MSRTLPPLPLTCDEAYCNAGPTYVCTCIRCAMESPETEQFHSCEAHKNLVGQKHARIRGDHHEVVWFKTAPSLRPPPPKYVEAEELFQLARDCLAGKSRSYIQDAKLFAKAVLLMEQGVSHGHIEIKVER